MGGGPQRVLGIEMGWLDNRLTLNLEPLRRETHEHAGGTQRHDARRHVQGREPGSMKKHGIDIELGWNDRTKSGFNYHLTALLSLNENRITNYEDAPLRPDYQKVAGKAYMGQTGGMSVVDSGYYETSTTSTTTPPTRTTGCTSISDRTKYLDYAVMAPSTRRTCTPSPAASIRRSAARSGADSNTRARINMLWTADFGKYVNQQQLGDRVHEGRLPRLQVAARLLEPDQSRCQPRHAGLRRLVRPPHVPRGPEPPAPA